MTNEKYIEMEMNIYAALYITSTVLTEYDVKN